MEEEASVAAPCTLGGHLYFSGFHANSGKKPELIPSLASFLLSFLSLLLRNESDKDTEEKKEAHCLTLECFTGSFSGGA